VKSFPAPVPPLQNYPHHLNPLQISDSKGNNRCNAECPSDGARPATPYVPVENSEEASKMKKQLRIVFSTLGTFALAAVALALPATTNHGARQQNSPHSQEAAQTQSVSGKIAAVETNSFTLTVGSGTSKMSAQMRQEAPKTMTFSIDKNTTVDGKLRVGANADVAYREDSGKNIAVSVRVAP
jgi:hypothetical protein